jgi:hypothetical protein
MALTLRALTRSFTVGRTVASTVLTLSVLGATTLRAQHVHGQASLIVGMEGAGGTAEFRGAGDDLYGFERAPRTAAERAKQEAALQRLRTQGAQLLRFDATLGCTVTPQEVRVVEERSGHGEVRAQYRIACKRPVAGKPLRFGFSAAFPGIDRVAVQLVSDTAQVGATISRDRGQVIP